LALANHSELAAQFNRFTRQIIGPADDQGPPPPEKRSKFLGLL
jgi:hypothetical protein